MYNKRGLNTVVTTLLLIMIGILAVILMWYFLRDTIVDLSGQIKTECVSLHLQPSKCVLNTDSVSVTLKRSPTSESVNLSQAKLIFNFVDGDSKIMDISGLSSQFSLEVPLKPILKSDIGPKEIKSISSTAVINYENEDRVCPLGSERLACDIERIVDDGSPTPDSRVDCTNNKMWFMAKFFEDELVDPILSSYWGNDIKNKWTYSPSANSLKTNGAVDKGYMEATQTGYSYVGKARGDVSVEVGYMINAPISNAGFLVTQGAINESTIRFLGNAWLLAGPAIGPNYRVSSSVGNGSIYNRLDTKTFTIPKANLPKALDLRLIIRKIKEETSPGSHVWVYRKNNVTWEYRDTVNPAQWIVFYSEINDKSLTQLDLDRDVDIRFKHSVGQYIRYVKVQSEEGLPCDSSLKFIRGDVAVARGKLEIADGVYIDSYLHRSGPAPDCMDAADIDDDGDIDDRSFNSTKTSKDYINEYLFSGGPPLSNPFPACGYDTTPDNLGCKSYPVEICGAPA